MSSFMQTPSTSKISNRQILFSFLITSTFPCTHHILQHTHINHFKRKKKHCTCSFKLSTHNTTAHTITTQHNNMASEQLVRRENTTTEREVYVEKDRVPKMATHFEHLAEQAKESEGKDTPQGSIEALQGGESNKDHAGKAIGDVGGRGNARESHELGSHFESLSDKVKGEDQKEKKNDHAMNVIGNKKREGVTREREARGGVGKFEMKSEGEERGNKGRVRDREQLERQTREVTGVRTEKERGRKNKGEVVAEKGRGAEETEKHRGTVGAENKGASATAVITCTLEHSQGNNTQNNQKQGEEQSGKSTWEEIAKHRNQAQKNVKERHERENQAGNETLNKTCQKDATLEKGQQQGYVAATKETISSAVEKTAPVAEKAKEYTLQAAEKAKSAGGTTASYVGEKAVQAKDVTVEGGKSAAGYAAKVAADLKDKAAAVGWAAAHFSTDMTVQGTKAAAHVVEGAAGYAGHKAAELASMSAGAVKGLAASAGETAKEYTAKKKEEAQRGLKAKKASQSQEASKGIGENVNQYAQQVKPSGGSSQQEGTGSSVLIAIGETLKKPFESIMVGEGKTKSENYQSEMQGQEQEQEQRKGIIGQTLTNIGEKFSDAKQREELLDNLTEEGGVVLGAVGETVAEIGQNMIKPAERVQDQRVQVRQEGGVLSAIGETIAEIAETTKVMVAGEGEREARVSVSAKREGSQSGRVSK